MNLYTLAKAGFKEEEYWNCYQATLTPSALEYLCANSQYFSFGGRDHGPLAGLLYFTPAYFNFQSTSELGDYFSAWNEAFRQKNPLPFAKYNLHPQELEEFFKADEQTWDNQIMPLDKIFVEIGKIYVKSFDTYKRRVWPQIEPILKKRTEILNQEIAPGLIQRWENCLGLNFTYKKYKVLLYYAGKQGPAWNNLSPDKNSTYFNHDAQEMIAMISHEFGIALLLLYLQDKVQEFETILPRLNRPGIYGLVSYMALESLAAFYNELISESRLFTGRDFNDYAVFKEIYTDLYRPGIDPLKIYVAGVAQYLEARGCCKKHD